MIFVGDPKILLDLIPDPGNPFVSFYFHFRQGGIDLICKKVDRCLQFFGKKVLDQFFLGGKTSDAFMGFDPVIVVDEPS